MNKIVNVQAQGNKLLREAILNERGRCWNKVANKYKHMLKLISKSNLPDCFISSKSYDMLLYESYYHLGVALQNLDLHREAVHAYTNAILSMNIPKNGCMAGCNSNTCFQTPVLAKRAFAHAKIGEMKNAFRDIEKAVVLDTRNPDLYCIRALLWNTRQEHAKAVEDLNRALTFNNKHVCSILLRGAMDNPFKMNFNILKSGLNKEKELNKDQLLVLKHNPNAAGYLNVTDIHDTKLISFWNRFLWSLNVPRTILHVDLTTPLISRFNNTINFSENENTKTAKPKIHRPASGYSFASPSPSLSFENYELLRPSSNPIPFRCGTPNPEPVNFNRARRFSYGKALQVYASNKQDKGVSEYIQDLVRNSKTPEKIKSSAEIRKSSFTIPLQSTSILPAISSNLKQTLALPKTYRPSYIQQQTKNKPIFTGSRKFHGPRMYYKPWSGDKLSVAELPKRPKIIAFRT